MDNSRWILFCRVGFDFVYTSCKFGRLFLLSTAGSTVVLNGCSLFLSRAVENLSTSFDFHSASFVSNTTTPSSCFSFPSCVLQKIVTPQGKRVRLGSPTSQVQSPYLDVTAIVTLTRVAMESAVVSTARCNKSLAFQILTVNKFRATCRILGSEASHTNKQAKSMIIDCKPCRNLCPGDFNVTNCEQLTVAVVSCCLPANHVPRNPT